MANLIDYARASIEDQDCATKEKALRSADCTLVRSEKRTGVVYV